MTLLLEIIGPQAAQLAEASRKLFVNAGGTIGRLPDSDWVVPDPFISGRHARIHYRDGRYLLEDTSTNGVFVKSRDNRLRKDELYILQNGDRVFIDDYEIKATIMDPQPDPRELTERLQPPPKSSASAVSPQDPLLTLPLAYPPDAIADAMMPDDYDPIVPAPTVAVSRPPAKSAAATASAPNAAPAGAVDFTALLLAAGIPQAQITRELSENIGRVLQVAVEGLLDVLRSRERIKDEFGMRMTTFKPVDNNPLKFSANVEDALHNLFVKHNAAYLQPVEAFEDAFREVRNHQMAMLAAVKIVFREMLTAFEPRRLQAEFDRQPSLLPIPAKLRYWQLYQEKFRGLAQDPDKGFRAAFGDKFANAYAEQLARLKAATSDTEGRG